MYNSRLARRSKRISDGKLSAKLRDRRRVCDEDDDDLDDITIGNANLTDDEIQGLLELLPYKDALIKIAKGEFEIERVEEAEEEDAEEVPAEAEEENFEEDEDFSEDDNAEDLDEEDFDEEENEVVEDSAVVDAWSKRLNNK